MARVQVPGRADEGRVLAEKPDEGSRQEHPLTSILSSLPKAGAVHGASPRAPQGRGGERGASRRGDSIETEHVARALLARYGVVFWQLLEREAPWLPPWRELLRVYRRLEARGEIRGGRFVEGLVGEQFALPEAIAPLRAIRQRADDGELAVVGGCDPLNLVGGVLAGDKVPAVPGSRVLYRDGMPLAASVAGKIVPLMELSAAEAQVARQALQSGSLLRLRA